MPGGYRYFNTAFPGKTLATDAAAFDWTVQPWMVAMLYDTLMDRTIGNDDSYAAMVFHRLMQVLGPDCIVRLPDGSRYRQAHCGVMKSGWLLTLMGNTNIMLASGLLAWERASSQYFQYTPDGYFPEMPPSWGMGDDVIMAWDEALDPEPFVKALNTTGIRIKQHSYDREFAGFRIERTGTVTPLYPAKHKTMIAHTPRIRLRDMATAYGLIYSLAEQVPADIAAFIDEYSPYSKHYYANWARGLPCKGSHKLDLAYALARCVDE